MAYLVGTVLACVVSIFARVVRFDRDRAFYPTVLVIVGSYYVLFAAMAGSTTVLLAEVVGMTAFAVAAVAGFKGSSWIVVAGLAGHGVFDAFHGKVLDNPGVPVWWPAFCGTYDVAAAACFAWILTRRKTAGERG